ncbi:hypothetical protein Ae505Ps2_6257c [Pseudonocardia sp. Ae505_Ps2]|nr:hypothetical protein Ae505Ps2_6257c [Pseudonocardia sp. Ae505_Ps2]
MSPDATTEIDGGERAVWCEVCLTPLGEVSPESGRRCGDHRGQLALVPAPVVCGPRRSPERDGDRR